MRILFLILLLLSTSYFASYAQIEFEEAYFIDNSGQKLDCLIKNNDWKYNPIQFEYKLNVDSDIQIAKIENVIEFGIINQLKYIRATVEIDRSSNVIRHLTNERNPIFREETLFLKVLIEGKATLYLYEEPNLIRFFFKNESSHIQQLVYKKYLYQGEKSPYMEERNIAYNNQFRQQLFIHLKCEDIQENDVKDLGYKKKDLMQLFVEYNSCMNSEFINFNNKIKRDFFNFSITPGLNFSSLEVNHSFSNVWDTDFGYRTNFRLGLEAEFILPFNKNKWGIVIEPTFQYFNKEIRKKTNEISGGIIISKIKYQSVEIPIGLRYYVFLNKKSKIFINGFYIFDVVSNDSKISYFRDDFSNLSTQEINTSRNLSLGIGYKFNNKYGVETRFFTNRKVLRDNLTWESDYKTISLILSYCLN